MRSLATIPEVDVFVDGASIDPSDARGLSEVRVQQRLSQSSLCELSFYEPAGRLSAGASALPGSSLDIAVRGHDEQLFAGRVTAITWEYGPSGARVLKVRSYDRLHPLRKRQPVCAHVQVTLLDLVKECATDLGLSVEADDPGCFWPRLIQHRQSDLSFITELAERCGLYLTLRGRVLHLVSLAGVGPPLRLRLGDSLIEARIEVNRDPACSSVTTLGWDPWRVEAHRGDADATNDRDRVSTQASESSSGTHERVCVDETTSSTDELSMLARAKLDSHCAREVTLRGVAEGDPRLQPGARIELAGRGDALQGAYVLTAVNHVINHEGGFVSEVDTTPPAPQTRPRGTVTTFATVACVDDPQRLGRVQVVLPSYGDVQSDWLQVVVAGAGPNKGIVALPDVGDQVLVLHPREDLARGVVVGGLYGTQAPPDTGVEDGAVRRYTLATPGGQRLQLDDTGNTVRFENSTGNVVELAPDLARLMDSNGSYLELSPRMLRLHAKSDLEIEAPGCSVTIRGRLIDFERA